jgi:hypothetical protein
MDKKIQFTTNDPSASTDYLAADNTWKPMTGGGGGVPTTRTITINGTTQDLSADRTWNVGDMLQSVYDTDVDGVVDSAERIQIVVRNSTGSTLTKGQIVYLSGATGNRPNAVLAQANSEATSSKTIGIVMANIANNSDGQIAVNGTLHDLDTSSFSAGDSLWLSATTAGGYVANTPPAEPNHSVFIGYVARAHPTQGRIVLAIQNGYELGELHGVEITSVANNDVLKYNSSTSLWENSNALSTKQDTITGAATTITSSNLTTYRALVSDGGGKVAVSGITSTELGYLSGVTSNIQTQLNSKSSVSKSFLVGNFGSSSVTGGGTSYGGFVRLALQNAGNEFQMRTIMPSACTFRNFTANVGAQPATGILVFTMRIDGVDTAYTLTIAAGSSSFFYQNTSTSLSVPNMSTITFKIVNNASSPSGAVVAVSVMVEI